MTARQQLLDAVRRQDHAAIAAVLAPATRRELYQLTVSLAAALVQPPAPMAPTGRQTQPHGTHAGFNRHRAAGDAPCPACWAGERTYQRARARTRRARTKTAAVRVDADFTPFTVKDHLDPAPPAGSGTCADGGDHTHGDERRAG